MGKNLVITIDRQNGSGGRYVGELLAKALGIKCYDEALIKDTAKQSGLDPEMVKRFDEAPRANFYFAGQPISMPVYEEQVKLIEHLSETESCVIIGRCADYILKEQENLVSVFLHAPLGARIERVCKREQIAVAKAEKQIRQKDKKRASYYNCYTGQKWGDAQHYHLCIDTSQVGIDGAVEVIRQFINNRCETAESMVKE